MQLGLAPSRRLDRTKLDIVNRMSLKLVILFLDRIHEWQLRVVDHLSKRAYLQRREALARSPVLDRYWFRIAGVRDRDGLDARVLLLEVRAKHLLYSLKSEICSHVD